MLIEIIEFMDSSSSDSDEELLCGCSSSSDDESEQEQLTASIDTIHMGEHQLKDNLLHCATADDGGGRLIIRAENIQHIGNPIPEDHIYCTSTSSSSETGNGQLTRATLGTVVEDQELSMNVVDGSRTEEGKPYLPMRLSKESLRKTQRRRLTVRRPRTHGYSVYNASISTPSINSVSGQYSVRSRKSYCVATPSSCVDEFKSKLIPKLEDVRRKQKGTVYQLNRFKPDGSSVIPTTPSHNQNDSQGHVQVLTDMMSKRLHLDNDNEQSILDKHVSRVWSDIQWSMIAGTMSPVLTEDSSKPIRRSKSMTVHTPMTKLTNKWPSDNGICGRSMNTKLRSRDLRFHPRSLEKAHPHPVQPQQSLPTESSAPVQFETVAFYTFLDEDLPYCLKLHSFQPTLRQFKEQLPRKGSFRFFFKTLFEDLDYPIVRQEIVNDDEILPLFEGKVKAFVKPCE